MTHSLLILDQLEVPIDELEDVYLWQGYSCSDSFLSVPLYVEEHAERLRSKYLAFIYELGESKFRNKRIVEHLEIDNGFSYWWMTTLAEKSPFKSPQIYACLKLLALEELLLKNKPSKLNLKSSDRNLISSIQRLCQTLKIDFYCHKIPHAKSKMSLRKIFRALPFITQGLIMFIWHVFSYWPLRHKEKKWFSLDSAVFILSYFIHLDGKELKKGRFYSRQWEQLPELISSNGGQINWLQHFLHSPLVKTIKMGNDYVSQINKSKNNELHTFLHAYLTFGVVARAFKRFMWINFAAWKLRRISVNFYSLQSGAWLWPLLRTDWLSSMKGVTASINCLWIELFDVAMRDMPHQMNGLYLCENQGWERAFLHSWRKHGHGKIIGIQHATVPFWHLYYFDDQRTINSKEKCNMPLPDKIAVNGRVAYDAFLDSGYECEQLVEVEALRYLSLMETYVDSQSDHENFSKSSSTQPNKDEVNILIVGDMIPESNFSLLELLSNIITLLPKYYKFTFKPHPALDVDLTLFPEIYCEKTSDKLDGVLKNFDMVLSANSTSAAVDAYLSGLPVVIGLNSSSLNLSPLRGQEGVYFISTSKELLSILIGKVTLNSTSNTQELFWLDKNLPKWKFLLESLNIIKENNKV